MKLGRRNWILLGSSALVALGGVKLFSVRDEDLVKAVIRTKLAHVKIADHELDRFAVDFLAFEREGTRTVLHKLVAEFPGWFLDDAVRRRIPVDLADRLTLFEREVCAYFMMSTGYLGAPAGRPLRYERLYDPYATVCQNPFFRST